MRAAGSADTTSSRSKAHMFQAGFASIEITPAVGTPLMGWGRPADRLATAVHDPLFARALWVQQGDQAAAIVALDLCFIGRTETERVHDIVARQLGLQPRQVLLHATHTHAGPAVGTYCHLLDEPPSQPYTNDLVNAIVAVIGEAQSSQRPARLRAAVGRTSLPMNRRQRANGQIINGPNPDGATYDKLPICFLQDTSGKPICLLFSISTHPVCFSGTAVSADYPGAAIATLEQTELGVRCALFLQGMAGDSRPRTLADGAAWVRQPGAQETLETGRILAQEVRDGLKALAEVEPHVSSALIETCWPLQPLPDAKAYEAIASGEDPIRKRWARHQLERLRRGTARQSAPILMHALQLGTGLRLVALEGEPCHPYGQLIERQFDAGVTIPIGYTGGEGLYLVTSSMLDEGGYECNSYREYHQPAPLAQGVEKACEQGVRRLMEMGVA